MFQTTNQIKKSNSFLMSLVILQLQVKFTSHRDAAADLRTAPGKDLRAFFPGRVGTMNGDS